MSSKASPSAQPIAIRPASVIEYVQYTRQPAAVSAACFSSVYGSPPTPNSEPEMSSPAERAARQTRTPSAACVSRTPGLPRRLQSASQRATRSASSGMAQLG